MKIQTYNAELAIANMVFMRLFSNIHIKRQDKDGSQRNILVNCQFAQRSRILKNWENAEKRASMTLPMITIQRTGYSRNADRLNNMHNEIKYETHSSIINYDILTPIPIDISYEVSLISKYPSDIDQIASNFMVFFNSDVYVNSIHPKFEGLKLKNQVIMEDSINEEHPDEVDSSADDLTISTFNFTFKTYLFGGNQKAKLIPSKMLSTYVGTYISDVVSVITPDQIEEFHKNNPTASVSALITQQLSGVISTYVDNPDALTQVYDGFTPIIRSIDMGFYPVPTLSNIPAHISAVDNYDLSVRHYFKDTWSVDTVNWEITP